MANRTKTLETINQSVKKLYNKKTPWRSLQIGVNVCTIITGFCTFMSIAYVTSYFLEQCVLYSDMEVEVEDLDASDPSLTVVLTSSTWGSATDCNYTTYGSLMTSVHAFIWCWFFLFMKKHAKDEKKEFPLLVGSVLTHAIFLVVCFVASSMISAGMDMWCSNLVASINKQQKFSHYVTCEETQTFNWTNIFKTEKHHVYSFLFTAKISSWLQTITVITQTLLCGYKLYRWILGATTNTETTPIKPKPKTTDYAISRMLSDGTENTGFDYSDINNTNNGSNKNGGDKATVKQNKECGTVNSKPDKAKMKNKRVTLEINPDIHEPRINIVPQDEVQTV